MKKKGFIAIIVIIIGVIIVSVVYYNKGKDGGSKTENKEIVIPEKCQGFDKNDSCSLFSCVVDMCWCDDSGSTNPVLTKTGEQITKEEDAVKIVSDYLKSIDSEYIYNTRAVKLNDIFYNVFSYDKDNDENVLTISFDGKILKTTCGI